MVIDIKIPQDVMPKDVWNGIKNNIQKLNSIIYSSDFRTYYLKDFSLISSTSIKKRKLRIKRERGDLVEPPLLQISRELNGEYFCKTIEMVSQLFFNNTYFYSKKETPHREMHMYLTTIGLSFINDLSKKRLINLFRYWFVEAEYSCSRRTFWARKAFPVFLDIRMGSNVSKNTIRIYSDDDSPQTESKYYENIFLSIFNPKYILSLFEYIIRYLIIVPSTW